MESTAVKILALLGFAAVFMCAAIVFARPLFAALDGALKKWRRMGIVPRVVAVMMATVATVEAQKSGMGDSNRVERVDRVDGIGNVANVKMLPVTNADSQLNCAQKLETDDIGNAATPAILEKDLHVSTRSTRLNSSTYPLYRLVSVKTNDSYSYAMPENAVRYPNWWMRGGYEDVFKLDLGDWRFPIGTNLVDYLWVYTWGKVRPRLKAKESEIAAVGAPMSAVSQASEFWCADGTNGSKILTWHNFFVGRVPISVYSVVPISAQLELFPSGDYIARSNLVERYYKRVNPDDFDDDGIPNDIDESPSVSDGVFFGPDNDLPEGANSNNYCWVDVVVSNANSLVTFIGDRPSNLPDPCFIAKPDVTNRVTLLIGKTYRVTSAQPIICTAKSNDDIIIDVHDSHSMTICYPVSYEIVDMARSVSRQIRMIPPSLVGTFNWNTNTCCTQVQTSPSELPKCAWDCACEGCMLGGFTFDYEGYSLNFGGIGCGCGVGDGDASEDNQVGALVSVSFSHKVLFYEEAYTNAPGDVVARRHSTNVTVRVEVYGGEHGGLLNLTRAGFDKLSFVSGDEMPSGSVMIAPNETREWNAIFAPLTHSEEKDDVVLAAQFSSIGDDEPQRVEQRLTVVMITSVTDACSPENRFRHILGVAECVRIYATPSISFDAISTSHGTCQTNISSLEYVAPTFACNDKTIMQSGDGLCEISYCVVEPNGYSIHSIKTNAYAQVGESGGFQMVFGGCVEPSCVSFAHLQVMEVSCVASDAIGYFAQSSKTNLWDHGLHGGGYWQKIMAGNEFSDTTEMEINSKPWNGGGSFTWPVPNAWQREGFAETNLFCSTDQRFVLHYNGTAELSKFGYCGIRSTNGVFRVIRQ